jgi:hypothetical protein
MRRSLAVGYWKDQDELTDLLHKYFQKSTLVEWLKIAREGQTLMRDVGCPDAVITAVAGQAFHGALWHLADQLGICRDPLVSLAENIEDRSVPLIRARLLELCAHGTERCDNEDCDICDTDGPSL